MEYTTFNITVTTFNYMKCSSTYVASTSLLMIVTKGEY